jgi:hypothetical protein
MATTSGWNSGSYEPARMFNKKINTALNMFNATSGDVPSAGNGIIEGIVAGNLDAADEARHRKRMMDYYNKQIEIQNKELNWRKDMDKRNAGLYRDNMKRADKNAAIGAVGNIIGGLGTYFQPEIKSYIKDRGKTTPPATKEIGLEETPFANTPSPVIPNASTKENFNYSPVSSVLPRNVVSSVPKVTAPKLGALNSPLGMPRSFDYKEPITKEYTQDYLKNNFGLDFNIPDNPYTQFLYKWGKQ